MLHEEQALLEDSSSDLRAVSARLFTPLLSVVFPDIASDGVNSPRPILLARIVCLYSNLMTTTLHSEWSATVGMSSVQRTVGGIRCVRCIRSIRSIASGCGIRPCRISCRRCCCRRRVFPFTGHCQVLQIDFPLATHICVRIIQLRVGDGQLAQNDELYGQQWKRRCWSPAARRLRHGRD